MIGATGLVRRVAVVGIVLAAVGGCASTPLKIDDLTLVGIRKFDAKTRAANADRLPRHMTLEVYRDAVFVEATLSTSIDVVGAVHRDRSWVPYSKKWQCSLGRDDGWMAGAVFEGLYQDGRQVWPPREPGSPPAANTDLPIAEPRAPVGGRYFYAVYFAVEKDKPGRGTRYDLAKSSTDVCLDFAEMGHPIVPSIESNVVIIPARTIEQVLAGDTR